jgi:hypothetical protein
MAQQGTGSFPQAILNSSFDPDLGLLATTNPGLALRVDDYSTPDVIYIGSAISGTLESAAEWQVKKIDTSTGVSITFADSDARFNNVWDNRTSLTYG